MPFIDGQTVGPYRILGQLGQGGMATVYKAYHAALDRTVALKAMHPAFMEDPNFLARFQREAQVVARLEHPNIVPIYDFAEHENRPYLVMKYIEGETLKARLARGPIAEDEILPIVESLTSALTHAHTQGILHRDVKPSNVLLASSQQIYLADFGLARIAEAGASTLSSDVMLGTPQYISPEQAMGKQELDARTDIYSFGVMLYEMVTGQVPFSADTPYSIIHDHIYTPLPLPRAINPKVSEGVERVLLKALAKERDDRFGDVADLGEAFGQAMKGAGVDLEVQPAVHEQTLARSGDAPMLNEDVPAGPDNLFAGAGEEQPWEGAQAEGTSAHEISARKGEDKSGRRWRWWYTVPLVFGLCLCGVITLSFMQNRPGANPEIPGGAGISSPVPPLDRPSGDSPGTTPQIASAQKVVDENPEDPFAHLELAAAYLDAGDISTATEIMGMAQELAGGENPEFFLAAGDLLMSRDQWFLAASMYLRLTRASDRPIPPDVRDRLEGAVYRAAEDGRVGELLDSVGELTREEQLLVDTVRGRMNLFQGRVPLAQVAVNNILRREPDYAPALLLQAEIHRSQGDIPPAVELLERLTSVDGPSWVPPFAEAMLVEIIG